MEQKCRINLMRLAIIKKAIQDEQQNQTTITTKIKYTQNVMSIKKNLQKLKIVSDKIETKQNKSYFTRKDMRPLYKKAR